MVPWPGLHHRYGGVVRNHCTCKRCRSFSRCLSLFLSVLRRVTCRESAIGGLHRHVLRTETRNPTTCQRNSSDLRAYDLGTACHVRTGYVASLGPTTPDDGEPADSAKKAATPHYPKRPGTSSTKAKSPDALNPKP